MKNKHLCWGNGSVAQNTTNERFCCVVRNATMASKDRQRRRNLRQFQKASFGPWLSPSVTEYLDEKWAKNDALNNWAIEYLDAGLVTASHHGVL